MLSIDFEILTKRHPEYADVWSGVQAWVAEHPRAPFLDTRALARDRRLPADPKRVAKALWVMRLDLNMEQVYKVLNPATNQYLPGEWASPPEIPEAVPDPFYQMIDVNDASIVPVLKTSKKSG